MKFLSLSVLSVIATSASALSEQDRYDAIKSSFLSCLGNANLSAIMSLYSDGMVVIEPSTNRVFDFTGADAIVQDCWKDVHSIDSAVIALSHTNDYGAETANKEALKNSENGPDGLSGVQIKSYGKSQPKVGKRDADEYTTGIQFTSYPIAGCANGTETSVTLLSTDDCQKPPTDTKLMWVDHQGDCSPSITLSLFQDETCAKTANPKVDFYIESGAQICLDHPAGLYKANDDITCNCCSCFFCCLKCPLLKFKRFTF